MWNHLSKMLVASTVRVIIASVASLTTTETLIDRRIQVIDGKLNRVSVTVGYHQ